MVLGGFRSFHVLVTTSLFYSKAREVEEEFFSRENVEFW